MSTPLRIMSLGAGVQSTTLVRMAIRGEIEPVDHAIFADTGWEPQAVYDHLAVLEREMDKAGIEFHRVSSGNLRTDIFDPDARYASMPVFIRKLDGKQAMARRQCTAEYKMKPLKAKTRELVGLEPRQRSKDILATMIIGISWDEAHRMKDPMYQWVENEYPLVDRRITREDCLAWNDAHDFPRPPRSSCIGCPFHNRDEWLAIRRDPVSWADAVEFDEAIRSPEHSGRFFDGRAYLHRKMVPLTQVDFGDVTFDEPDAFGGECEGLCGV